MFNNAYRVHDLAAQLDNELIQEEEERKPVVKESLPSDLCLLSRLPSTSFLEREGESSAPKSLQDQLTRSPSPPTSPTDSTNDSQDGRKSTSKSDDGESSTSSKKKSWFSLRAATPKMAAGWREPQPYEVFRAIERKDIMFLMEVRDRAFHLLLRKNGDTTPLVHAMRIGDSHSDVAILIVGAMSRWVNHLEDSDMADKRTKPLLKALRTNLKLAIDYGLQRSQSDLIASFMQTLIMSEGERWVIDQTHLVALALRAGTEGKPVRTAETIVRKFATRELGKAELIASLEDYIANATADLLVLAAWSCMLDSIQGEPIPTYYFARDTRVFNAFQERLNECRGSLARINRRLKWQIRVLEKVLEGRHDTFRKKIELLANELDEGLDV
ncbi:uncharacterized protein FOMMEDRAFT_21744 [Fomitiporia mediterranea MF3/22]|uniref:uncharacterized protein n=1 Tax=Fomitiporia mediterranea (strain MF3/22) TaxID=694068 RepID=UPI0004408D48|nr:uncharacterized protein FOMMEDRAFT_21744 [Fomitiporia mediterranea MF3/22]EJD01341.1 hypothetical protein FOMMEDRAFT_21744 [Fomitiporia mediterranea MF3/22]